MRLCGKLNEAGEATVVALPPDPLNERVPEFTATAICPPPVAWKPAEEFAPSRRSSPVLKRTVPGKASVFSRLGLNRVVPEGTRTPSIRIPLATTCPIAFGVAPGFLAFQWAMKSFGRFGWLAAFLYVVCGALRLARFNVQKSTTDSSFFKGLPIPAGACFIASLILFVQELGGMPENPPVLFVVMIYILSFLMVSTIRYPSFKKVDIRNQKPFNVLVSLILMLVVIAYQPRIMIFIIMSFYALSGPVSAIYRLLFRRRKLAEGEGEKAVVEPGSSPAQDQSKEHVEQ